MLPVYFRLTLMLNCHACPFAAVWVPAFLTSKAFFLVLQIFSSVVTFTFKFHNDFERKAVSSYLILIKKKQHFQTILVASPAWPFWMVYINKADFQSMQEEFENPTPKKVC